MTEFLTRTRIDRLDAEDARLLDAQGYLLLRAAIPAVWIGPLRDAFETGAMPSDQWPVPRGQVPSGMWLEFGVAHSPVT